MNEEEIIKNVKEMIQWNDHNTYKTALQGLLDLYNKEKERNKDLEQIEKEHKEENGRLRKENINLKEKIIRQQEQLNIANKKILAQKGQLKVVNNSYIPKSKIKEKMEELTKIKGDLATYIATSERIKVLQELLEESKK